MLLLNIQSSPRAAKSASIAMTNAFLGAYHALHSDVTDTLNVWEEHLPDPRVRIPRSHRPRHGW
jgi:FMN-dependent NADH-azoreductase